MSEGGENNLEHIGKLPAITIPGKIRRAKNYDQAGISPKVYEDTVLAQGRGAEANTVRDVFATVVPVERADGSPSVVLDVAAGTGILSKKLAEKGYQVIATDLSNTFLEYLSKQSPHIETTQGDMNTGLPVTDASVDAVTILGSNRYITDVEKFVDEVKRVLRPGGIFVWPVTSKESKLWKKNAGDKQLPTTPEELEKVLQAHGFVEVESGEKDYAQSGIADPLDYDLTIGFVVGKSPPVIPS